MKNILLVSIFIIVSHVASGQTFSYGIKAGYVTYQRFYVNRDIEGTQIRQGNGYIDGLRFSALTRAEYKRWSGQVEIAYAYNIGENNGNTLFVDNWNNPSNTVAVDYWAVSATPLLKQIEFNLTAGYKPLKWVRLFAGLGAWNIRYKNKSSLDLYDETLPGFEDVSRSRNEMNRFRYGIQESYLPWVLTRQLGIGFEIKRNFSLDIAYDRNLTPVSKSLEYKGQNYLFRQRSDRFVISVGYRFYSLRKKPQA